MNSSATYSRTTCAKNFVARPSLWLLRKSYIKESDRLWNEYGGRGNGACVEIEIPDQFGSYSIYPVKYVCRNIFHVDSFLESLLFQDKVFDIYKKNTIYQDEKMVIRGRNKISFKTPREESRH